MTHFIFTAIETIDLNLVWVPNSTRKVYVNFFLMFKSFVKDTFEDF